VIAFGPVQRGGAGESSRNTSGTVAGPASAHVIVMAFTLAVRWPQSARAQAKVIAAVAEHLDAEPDVVIIDERHADGRLWLRVALVEPLAIADARRIAAGCPGYVADTFAAVAAAGPS